jgi:hypothetical protein
MIASWPKKWPATRKKANVPQEVGLILKLLNNDTLEHDILEARMGIEPIYAALQADRSRLKSTAYRINHPN